MTEMRSSLAGGAFVDGWREVPARSCMEMLLIKLFQMHVKTIHVFMDYFA